MALDDDLGNWSRAMYPETSKYIANQKVASLKLEVQKSSAPIEHYWVSINMH